MTPITLYNENGNTIKYNSSKAYTVTGSISVEDSFGKKADYYFNNYYGKLGIDENGNLALTYLNYWGGKKLTALIINCE